VSQKTSLKTPEPAPGGLYIHIPFCLQKCRYCNFYSISDQALIPVYLRALEAEIASLAGATLRFDTLYIGGGTPSLLSARQLERLIRLVRRHLEIAPGSEITLEVNPGTTTASRLQAYRQAGVNRLSIGVQSFNSQHLKALGRLHSAAENEDTVRAARITGFDSISLDLIYGIFGQTAAQLAQDLDQTVALDPDHVSAYTLTIEPETPLGVACRRGQVTPLNDNQAAQMITQVITTLTDHGYRQYEISNFSKSGHRSRHNQKYWYGAPYVGLGAAAHSYQPPERYWNRPCVKGYLRASASDCSPCAGSETLSTAQQLAEFVMLRLRTTDGFDLGATEQQFGINLERLWKDVMADLRWQGLLLNENKRVTLTQRGMLVADAVTRLLLGNLPADLPGPR
jgi:oxygen-independent coproporphyrinogen-3 oxidase